MPQLLIQGKTVDVKDGDHLLDILRQMEREAIPIVVKHSKAYKKPDLEGEVCLITGAARGLGKAIAYAAAAQGMKLALGDIDNEGIHRLAKELEQEFGHTNFFPYHVNITNESDVKNMVEATVNKYGKLSHLVNTAVLQITKPTCDMPLEDFKKVMEVNTIGYFILAKESVKVMLKNKYGVIVAVNSKTGKRGSAENVPYAASKFSIVGINQSISLEHGKNGIRANTPCFGNFLYSPLWTEKLFADYKNKGGGIIELFEKYRDQSSNRSFCEYVDATSTVLYLLSKESKAINGQTMIVDQGYLLQ